MGTAKRERQKAGRQSRRVEAEIAAKKSKRNRNLRNYGIYAAILVAVGVFIVIRYGGDDDNTTTTTGTTVPVSTVPTGTTVFSYGTTDCPPATGATEAMRAFTAPFKQCIDVTKTYTAIIKTSKGDLTVEFDPIKAPGTVNNFVSLALNKYFDGITCHRIIPGFVVQCGDPTGTGTGGPGFKFADELPQAGEYKLGSLAMANSGADTNGSQFFIISGQQGIDLPPNYSLFGQVTAGADTTLKALDATGTAAGTPTEAVLIQSVTITVS
ncbi:MAG TPA: peptidylprolyl isomerase [Acidimicrobiales bacterium]|nr:peptidylprolyl isomerase [Acidimicrobiales bacterium]